MRKKRLWPKRTYYSRNGLKGLRKTTKNLRVGPHVKVGIQDLAQKRGCANHSTEAINRTIHWTDLGHNNMENEVGETCSKHKDGEKCI
jgi:hypothetical protein